MDRNPAELHSRLLAWAAFLISRGLIFTCGLATGDVEIYHRSAVETLSGGNPYEGEERFGYPPLALFYVLLPALISGPRYASYYELFRIESFLVDVALFSLIQARSRDPRAGLLYSLTTLILGHLIYHRLDLVVGILCFSYVFLLGKGLRRWAYLGLGVAVAFKAIPIVLVPPAIAWEWKGSRREAVLRGGMLAVGALTPTLAGLLSLGPSSVVSLSGHAERGVQLESLWASLTWLLGYLGLPAEVYFAGGSYNLRSPLEPAFVYASYVGLLLVVGFAVFLAIRLRHRAPERLPLLLLFALVGGISLSKVLSPQFLLIVCAFFPAAWTELGGRRSTPVLLLLVVTLTTMVYPYQEHAMNDSLPSVMFLLLLRNALLVALGVTLARNLLRT